MTMPLDFRNAFVAFLLLLLLVPASCFGQVRSSIEFDSMTCFVQLSPGEDYTETFEVINRGDQPLALKVVLKDFTLTEKGELKTLAPGTLGDHSLAGYITYAPDQMTLEPGQSQRVTYSFTLPADATGPHWVALIVMPEAISTVTAPPEGEEGITLIARFQLNYAFVIIQRPLYPPKSIGQIAEIDVSGNTTREGKKMLAVRSTFQNLCGDILRCQVYMEVRDEAGEVILRYDFPPDRVVFPQAQRIFSHTFEDVNMPLGQYLILCVVDFGGDYLAAGQHLATVTALP